MPTISSNIIFCEDVREEIGGTSSIVGITGPILTVPSKAIEHQAQNEDKRLEVRRLCVFYYTDIDGIEEVDAEFELLLSHELDFPLPSPLRQRVKNLGISGFPWRIKASLRVEGIPFVEGMRLCARSKVGDSTHETYLLMHTIPLQSSSQDAPKK